MSTLSCLNLLTISYRIVTYCFIANLLYLFSALIPISLSFSRASLSSGFCNLTPLPFPQAIITLRALLLQRAQFPAVSSYRPSRCCNVSSRYSRLYHVTLFMYLLSLFILDRFILTSWCTHPVSGISFVNHRWIAERQIQIKLLKIFNFHEITSAI